MDQDCTALLQWALPRRQLRWPGYRHVRSQVCKRLRRRIATLGLRDMAAYRAQLEADPAEWTVFEGMCAVTISRFYRDRGVWDTLRSVGLPLAAEAALGAGETVLRCWSLGCASGEEPYTLSLVWSLEVAARYRGLALRVLATDVGDAVLARARAARYASATLRDLPPAWRARAFEVQGTELVLREEFRGAVELRRQDVRKTLPDETFRVVLCRNSVLTYFEEELQRRILEQVLTRLAPGGIFVIGRHERLPAGARLSPWRPERGIYRRAD